MANIQLVREIYKFVHKATFIFHFEKLKDI